MAFDKNNTTLGMKIIIVLFAVVLVIGICMPFFSSCSMAPSSSSQDTQGSTSSSSEAQTTAQVDETYGDLISTLESRLEADPGDLSTLASLGNNYMDWGQALQQASDASENEEHISETFAKAVDYYDQYLEEDPDSNAVRVDRACCMYYAGQEDEAIAALEDFTAENDSFAPAWANLGIFLYLQDDLDAAKDAFNQAIEADPEDAYNVSTICQMYVAIIESQQEAEAEAAEEDEAADESATDETATDAEADAAEGAESDASATDDADTADDAADTGTADATDGDSETDGASTAE